MNALFVKTPTKLNRTEDLVTTAMFPAQPAYLIINAPKSTSAKGKPPFTNTETEPQETDSFFIETDHANTYPIWSTPSTLTPSIALPTNDLIAAVGTGGTGGTGIGLIDQPHIAAVSTGGTGIDLSHTDPIAAVGIGGTGGMNTGVVTEPKLPTQPIQTPTSPIILADNNTAIHDPLNSLHTPTPAENAPILSASLGISLNDVLGYSNDANTSMDEPTGGTVAVYLPLHNTITQMIQHTGNKQNLIEPAAQTDDATPTLCGTAETGALLVQVYDNGELIGSAAVQSNGTWTFTPDHPLSSGAHNIHISSIDGSGQAQSTSPMWHITIDPSGQNPSLNTDTTSGNNDAQSIPTHNILDWGLCFDSSESSHGLWTSIQQGATFNIATPEPAIHPYLEASSTLSYMTTHIEDLSFMAITSSHY